MEGRGGEERGLGGRWGGEGQLTTALGSLAPSENATMTDAATLDDIHRSNALAEVAFTNPAPSESLAFCKEKEKDEREVGGQRVKNERLTAAALVVDLGHSDTTATRVPLVIMFLDGAEL